MLEICVPREEIEQYESIDINDDVPNSTESSCHLARGSCDYCFDEKNEITIVKWKGNKTATAGSDVVQSGRPIFDDFFQHLWPYIGNTANVVFQMVKRLWLIHIDQ
ncbi:hypothetical protein TNCV_4043131 [Trichonephila clavipes]|nr:hypothetical protein TNCV_4043131 [Trichonephila clavipes]